MCLQIINKCKNNGILINIRSVESFYVKKNIRLGVKYSKESNADRILED